MIVQTKPCVGCQKTSELDVPEVGYQRWLAGDLIQDALPALSADDRELLISGTHPACWDELFGEPDEADLHLRAEGDATKPLCGAMNVPVDYLVDSSDSELVNCEACLDA